MEYGEALPYHDLFQGSPDGGKSNLSQTWKQKLMPFLPFLKTTYSWFVWIFPEIFRWYLIRLSEFIVNQSELYNDSEVISYFVIVT